MPFAAGDLIRVTRHYPSYYNIRNTHNLHSVDGVVLTPAHPGFPNASFNMVFVYHDNSFAYQFRDDEMELRVPDLLIAQVTREQAPLPPLKWGDKLRIRLEGHTETPWTPVIVDRMYEAARVVTLFVPGSNRPLLFNLDDLVIENRSMRCTSSAT